MGPGCLRALVDGRALQAGAVALVLQHASTRGVALAELAGLGHLLLCRAARKGHGAGVLELLAAGADARGRDLKGVLALAHLRAAEGKRRNEGKDRGKEYQRAVAALTAATGTAEGGGTGGSGSDGELLCKPEPE